jgi:hypothetical protein
MTGKRLLLGGPIAALCLLMILGGIRTRAQHVVEQLTASEVHSLNVAVAQAKPAAVSMLVQDFHGAFTQANIKAQVTAVEHEAMKQNLDSVWGTTHPIAVVIVLEDPTGKAQVNLQVGLTLPHAGVHATAPLKVVTLNFPKAVRYTHQGQYEKLGAVHNSMHKMLQDARKESASFPEVHNARDDPFRVAPVQIRTVVLTPVR